MGFNLGVCITWPWNTEWLKWPSCETVLCSAFSYSGLGFTPQYCFLQGLGITEVHTVTIDSEIGF